MLYKSSDTMFNKGVMTSENSYTISGYGRTVVPRCLDNKLAILFIGHIPKQYILSSNPSIASLTKSSY